jgi:hypothetical protein
MKARVKGTVNIIEVEFDRDALNACYPPYHDKENNMYYYEEQLEWVDNEVNVDPDYWTRLEHQAAIAAMGGICGNTSYDESSWEEMAEDAILAAHFFVQKLKEKEERK